jgi:hypothetical protein
MLQIKLQPKQSPLLSMARSAAKLVFNPSFKLISDQVTLVALT